MRQCVLPPSNLDHRWSNTSDATANHLIDWPAWDRAGADFMRERRAAM